MAVEKSYARLGFFIVVVAGRGPRNGGALHSTDEEPCRDQHGHLHHRERQWPGCLEPRSVQGRAGGPCHRTYAWIHAGTPSKSTSRCSSIASTPLA